MMITARAAEAAAGKHDRFVLASSSPKTVSFTLNDSSAENIFLNISEYICSIRLSTLTPSAQYRNGLMINTSEEFESISQRLSPTALGQKC